MTSNTSFSMKKTLTWLPRILTIIFICFISMFALDEFSDPNGFWLNLAGFLIHLVPSFALIICLILAWKKPLIGGIIFIFLSVVFTFAFDTYEDVVTLLIISFPLLLVGILYLVDFHLRKK